jgi:spoIIIJ-associated protein
MVKTFEGPTEAEAAIKACEALGVSRSRLKYHVMHRATDSMHVVIEIDEGAREEEPQPEHLAREYDRAHRGVAAEAPRSDRQPGGFGRGPRTGGGGRDRGGRGGRDRRPRQEEDPFHDNLAEEFKEFREMTAAPKEPVERRSALAEDLLSDRATTALATTRELLRLAALDAAAQISVDGEEVQVDMYGSDEGLIIGRKGETLLALQFLVNRIAGRERQEGAEGHERILLDCEGYRVRRQEALRVLALKLGEKARAEGKTVSVSPMNAHDRRIFHVTLDGQHGVKTRSEGEGVFRRVMIIPDQEAAS